MAMEPDRDPVMEHARIVRVMIAVDQVQEMVLVTPSLVVMEGCHNMM